MAITPPALRVRRVRPPPRLLHAEPPLARLVFLDLRQKLRFLPLVYEHPDLDRHTAGPLPRHGEAALLRAYERFLERLAEEKPEGVENESVEQVAFADKILLNKIG